MSKSRSSIGVITASIALLLTAGAAVAVTSGKVLYEAGKRSKPPYVLLTMSKGKVTKVRWAIHEGCGGVPPFSSFTSEAQRLNASIKHGRFSKTVHYTLGGSPVAVSTGTTTITGTVSGKHVTVKVSDEQDIASWGICSGSHTFKATRTTKFR